MNNGFHIHEINPYYLQAKSEHRDLHAAVERIHRELDDVREVDASIQQVSDVTRLVADLRDRLKRHFQQEEQGGYLEEAVVRVPQIAPQATLLQRQHEEFLKAADAMLEHANSNDPAPQIWAALKAGYLLFAKKLNAHEAAENALLGKAFNEDSGLDG